MKVEAITKEITDIVIWYGKTLPNELQITELLDKATKLVSYLWLYSDYVTGAKIEFNKKRFIRKIDVSRTKVELMNSGLSGLKAEPEALLAHEDSYMIELESEGISYASDILLRQANKVWDDMRTRISYYKQEKQQQQ